MALTPSATFLVALPPGPNHGCKLFFTTDQLYQVVTAGRGSKVELVLRRVATGESSSSTEPLENTYWKLNNLGNTPVPAPSEQKEPHFVLDSETRRVSGSGRLQPPQG